MLSPIHLREDNYSRPKTGGAQLGYQFDIFKSKQQEHFQTEQMTWGQTVSITGR